jgi:hypothetical protein
MEVGAIEVITNRAHATVLSYSYGQLKGGVCDRGRMVKYAGRLVRTIFLSDPCDMFSEFQYRYFAKVTGGPALYSYSQARQAQCKGQE